MWHYLTADSMALLIHGQMGKKWNHSFDYHIRCILRYNIAVWKFSWKITFNYYSKYSILGVLKVLEIALKICFSILGQFPDRHTCKRVLVTFQWLIDICLLMHTHFFGWVKHV